MDALRLSLNPAADELLTRDSFALLAGMLLDQQIPMERAFAGPYLIAERLGDPDQLDPCQLAAMDVDAVISLVAAKPAVHRFPKSMATRLHTLAAQICQEYSGNTALIWEEAADGQDCLRRLKALPGFGDQKARIFLALLLKSGRLPQNMSGAVEACSPYGDPGVHMSVADVNGPESLERVRIWKRQQKEAAKNS